MIWALYPFLLAALSPIAFIVYALRYGWARASTGLSERLAINHSQGRSASLPDGKRLWFHIASIGELEAVREVLQSLKDRHRDWRFTLTTLTPEAKNLALREHLADEVRLAPLDIPIIVRRWISRTNPSALVLIETELWPGLIREASRSGRKIILINGRLSSRSLKGWIFFKPWIKELLRAIRPLLVRTELDRRGFVSLGAPPEAVIPTGNLKVARATRRKLPDRETLSKRFFMEARRSPVIVAGSTWPKEEEMIARAVLPLRKKWPDLLLIVAPRRTERAREVQNTLQVCGFKAGLRSEQSSMPPDALVIDTLGELADVYGLGNIAVIGRSFVDGGGQSPIEPAVWGIPILFGPSMENFQESADELVSSGGARWSSPESLGAELERILMDDSLRQRMGDAAKRYIDSQSQILEKTLDVLESALAT